jgi:hypothetical protein
MPTNRHPIRHPRRGRLNHAQEMTLRFGLEPRWDAFRTAADHHDAWLRNRDHMLASYRHGRRPMAWWRFEAGSLKYPGYDREQSTLYEAGLLAKEEAAELVAWWREQFEWAHGPHFFHCEGPGRFFYGAPGRRRHFKWADIPRELLKQWTAQRRRRGKTIRELEGARRAEPSSAA